MSEEDTMDIQVHASGSGSPTSQAMSTWRQRQVDQDAKRKEQEIHHHKDVYVKLPHNGPYVKSGNRKGYDALLETPNGTQKQVMLGFEQSQKGLTTNFVGNHMTQGAIDLVQSSLAKKDREHEMRKLQRYQCTYHPPKRVETTPIVLEDADSNASRREMCQKYAWYEHKDRIVVEMPLENSPNPSVTHQFQPQSMRVEALDNEANVTKVLHIPKLFKRIVPQRSTCEHNEKSNKIVVSLYKEDESSVWTTLSGSFEPALPSTEPGAKPDLALLRRAIREQRKNKQAGDGMLYVPMDKMQSEMNQLSVDEEEEIDRNVQAALQGCTVAQIMEMSDTLVSLGDFHKASLHLTCALIEVGAEDAKSKAAALFERSKCYGQLGKLKRAIADIEKCMECEIECFKEPGLLALSQYYEMLEKFEKSMECIKRILQMNPRHKGALSHLSRIQASIRKAEDIKKQEDLDRADQVGSSDLLPSIPRTVPPQFENRGKSGAVF